MKVKDITETGFYVFPNLENTEDEVIFEVIENSDEEWVKQNPNAKLLVDEWCFDTVEKGHRIYQTSGNLQVLYLDLAECDVEKTDRKFKVFGNMGAFLKEKIKMKILTECIYDFYKNTIRRGKAYEVTEETSRYYYVERIGKSFYKDKENKPIVDLNCGLFIKIFGVFSVNDNYEKYPTATLNSFQMTLVGKIQDELKERLESIELC